MAPSFGCGVRKAPATARFRYLKDVAATRNPTLACKCFVCPTGRFVGYGSGIRERNVHNAFCVFHACDFVVESRMASNKRSHGDVSETKTVATTKHTKFAAHPAQSEAPDFVSLSCAELCPFCGTFTMPVWRTEPCQWHQDVHHGVCPDVAKHRQDKRHEVAVLMNGLEECVRCHRFGCQRCLTIRAQNPDLLMGWNPCSCPSCMDVEVYGKAWVCPDCQSTPPVCNNCGNAPCCWVGCIEPAWPTSDSTCSHGDECDTCDPFLFPRDICCHCEFVRAPYPQDFHQRSTNYAQAQSDTDFEYAPWWPRYDLYHALAQRQYDTVADLIRGGAPCHPMVDLGVRIDYHTAKQLLCLDVSVDWFPPAVRPSLRRWRDQQLSHMVGALMYSLLHPSWMARRRGRRVTHVPRDVLNLVVAFAGVGYAGVDMGTPTPHADAPRIQKCLSHNCLLKGETC